MTGEALHAGRPFRAVVHIEDRKGPRGGEYWALTLECGHTAFRSTPPPQTLAAALHPIIYMRERKRLRPLVRSAPRRVKCLSCAAEAPHE